MMITFTEAARLAGVSKGAVRKAALETQKLKAQKDEHGVWRIDVADVQRLWPQRPPLDTVTTPQNSPVIVGDSPQEAAVVAKLEAAEQRLADKDAVIDDLRRRLDQSEEERRQVQARLTERRK